MSLGMVYENQPMQPEKGPRKDDPADGQDLWRYLGLGTVLALTVAVFVVLGWWLDQRYGWSPWGVLVLGTLGVAAGMYHFVKDALK